MLRQNTSVATLAIVTLMMVATVLLGTLGVINYAMESRDARTTLETQTTTIANQMAAALALPLWNFDRPQIDKIIDVAMESPDVYAVIVQQRDVSAPGGMAVYTRMRDAQGKVGAASGAFSPVGLLVQERSIDAAGEPLGSVKMFVTTKVVEQRLRKSLLLLAGRIILFDLILIVSLYVLLRRIVLTPLKSVEQYASIVSSGGSHAPTIGPRRFSGEIESLRLSIEKMITLLDDRYTALQKSEEQCRYLFDQNIVGVVICDVICDQAGTPYDFRLAQANPAFEKLTGHKREAQVGKTYKDLDWHWPADLVQKYMSMACSGGELTYERYNEGLGKFFEVHGFSPKLGQFALMFNDITERKRAEAVLLESEKMRTIAGLSAGMAHEINNPLAGILQSSQVILNRVSPELPANRQAAEQCGTTIEMIHEYMKRRGVEGMLEAIRTSGERAAGIVANMLSFSRKSSTEMHPVNLSALLEKTLALANNDFDFRRNLVFRRVQIERDFDPDLPDVECQETEIQQVILNLLKNASQVLAEGGMQNGNPHIALRTRRDGATARIEVEDNGPGMTDVVRSRVFEPFFTTKRAGEGTGLGLSVSYFIITENHSGAMSVESSPGKGARFIIQLPLRQKASA